jgi:hypothetical protein
MATKVLLVGAPGLVLVAGELQRAIWSPAARSFAPVVVTLGELRAPPPSDALHVPGAGRSRTRRIRVPTTALGYTPVSVAVADPPPANDRLARFRAIRAKLDPTGDPASAISAFYVDSPHSVSARLAAELAIAPGSSHLLVGGVGSGKTTELFALQRRLTSETDIMALYVDVSKQHDIARMVPGAVIAQVGLALADWVAEGDPKNSNIRAMRDIAYGAWEDPNSTFGGDGLDLSFVPGILVPPEQLAESVQRALTPFEALLAVVRRETEHVTVMLDGLDRLADPRAFEQIVIHDVNSLSSLHVGTVLVGPLRALYGLDRVLAQRFDSLLPLPWIDATANPKERAFLVGVLTKRAGEALASPGIDALVNASGGVLRDLLSLAQSALVEAYMGGSDSIGSHEVDDAVDAFGRKHLQGLRPAELEVLQRVRTQGKFVHTSEDDLALLMTRRVLEYRSGNQPRYAVHPTIRGLLQDLEGK